MQNGQSKRKRNKEPTETGEDRFDSQKMQSYVSDIQLPFLIADIIITPCAPGRKI